MCTCVHACVHIVCVCVSVCVFISSLVDQTTPTPARGIGYMYIASRIIHPVLRGGSGLVSETVCVCAYTGMCVCVLVNGLGN